ncbi:MAG: riboflavin biosynthesis protein RibF [Clostridia bacterium]|nr:riboflavin biosynthesis protein RibF [Clostridia bacterium]
MKCYNLKTECLHTPIVIALGFFDCIHKGHKSLIDEVSSCAKRLDAETAITTFSNDPAILLQKEQQIYTFEERKHIFENSGIQNILYAEFDDAFMSCTATKALDILTSDFNIKTIVVGKDFTFGKGAEGNVDFLNEYMKKKGIPVVVLPFTEIESKKLSSSTLKNLVKTGQMQSLNDALTQPYFMLGKVIHGKSRGKNIGIPTANLEVSKDRLAPACGIYSSKAIIDGKSYTAVTNIGIKPTFDDEDFAIETHILNFNGDLYDKVIYLELYKKLRDIQKFNSVDEFVAQVNKDIKNTEEFFKQ